MKKQMVSKYGNLKEKNTVLTMGMVIVLTE